MRSHPILEFFRSTVSLCGSLIVALPLSTSVAVGAELDRSATVSGFSSPGCSWQGWPERLLPSAQGAASNKTRSKGALISGATESALERVTLLQEQGLAVSSSELGLTANLTPVSSFVMTDDIDNAGTACWGGDSSTRSPNGPDDFLASKRLPIATTIFDAAWNRVRADRISNVHYRSLIGKNPGAAMETLSLVNAWVNKVITYAEDQDLFARPDFWAGAARTLKLRRGDCEDIALMKMQLLSAAGISQDDMILTIVRDLVRNADHAVLIVRLEGKYYLLDNASDEIIDASNGNDYRPVLSFGANQTWLHGY